MKTGLAVIALLFLMTGCTGVPKGIEPVTGFDQQRYLGTWYEIARLDHSFEEGLSQVTAEYSLNNDGSIKVVNRGYNAEAGEWKEAEGRAVFVGDSNVGHLKVSFFGPFYASYVVFELDDQYTTAYITGYDRDYLWLMSRTPEVSDEVLEAFRARAEAEGFELGELIVVEQSR
ncbi:lipocalin family protein [Marinobacter nauticus]|jgi:apolipoprotein D and lipocalin family protein|uniref:Outer membrane lipoprotein Blc n=1 Tax=Marinobacter nauticus TaxID=2743 RepID=A0A368V5P6_MARNT|nr:lipocalin family protein [Marinobacter nauticus]RBP75619.1 apolipoprotein D and lipocalin family protein [Marinobacter nauticus]RCW36428.1 apolipoprotein D and lipocalin family protein [Marinobacter nauticus]